MPSKEVILRRQHKRIQRRRKHIRKVVFGTADRPRLVIFRSNKHIYAQIIDDKAGRTLFGCSSLTPDLKEKVASAKDKKDVAGVVGEKIAEIAKDRGVEQVKFDRNGRLYHGRVRVFAEAARKGGLKF